MPHAVVVACLASASALGALERKYKTEDAGIKKFLVARFLDFKMIDSKSVVSQVQESQVIIHDLLAEGLIVNDAFQVAAIVEKLPPLWKDFKNYLKHKCKEMTVENLIVRLRIEEDNIAAERSNQSKKKFKGKCFNCGKIGHKSTNFHAPKKGKKKHQANMIKSNKECNDLCAMFSECNLMGNPREWWMDFGATRHVCANKELFSSFAPAQVEEMMYTGNSATAKVLDKFKYMEFGIAKTPLDTSFALRKNEGESDLQLEYARVLRCLMYIMNCTRSDIACTISKLSRYTSNPNKTHWMAMKRVLGYLKYNQNYALHYNKYPTVLEGYSDANWITGSNEVKSTSGYVYTIDGGAVSWKSSKQTCIARSTMESEFISLDKAGEETEWLWNFLEDISYCPKPVALVCIHCDSQTTIGKAGSMMYNGKSHHIRRRHNTVRELLSSGIITVDYVKSKDNVSGPLTKGLSREGVERTSKGMGLRPRTSQHNSNST
ncbi:putative phosphoserine aminotransferase, chloroplastic-like [Capsicum annuum]|nr:putative phosphoserine aminotransferase, chloroplastic-like [Capsicum annuum]